MDTAQKLLTGLQQMLERDPVALLLIAAVAFGVLFLLSASHQPKTKGRMSDGELASLDAHDQPPAADLRVAITAYRDPEAMAWRVARRRAEAAALKAISPSECTGVSQDSDLQATRGVEIADSRNTPPHRPAFRVVNGQGR